MIKILPHSKCIPFLTGCIASCELVLAASPLQLSSPQAGQNFTPGTHVQLSIRQADWPRQAKIQYFANDEAIGNPVGKPFVLDWVTQSSGRYRLSARRVGASSPDYSTSVPITINAMPVVTLLSPDAYSKPSVAPLTLRAEAHDTDGLIRRISFIGITPQGVEQLLGTVNGSGKGSGGHNGGYRLDITLGEIETGAWRIFAKAEDDLGGYGFSVPITIWLENTTARPPDPVRTP